MSSGARLACLFVVTSIILGTIGPIQTARAARDEDCFWTGFQEYTYLDEVNFLGALGCRLNSRDQWVTGRILDERQRLIDVPSKHRNAVDEVIDEIHREIERMLEDRRIGQLFEYDLETGELTPGPDFFRNPQDYDGVIETADLGLYDGVGGPQAGSYAEAAIYYLSLPGNEAIAGYTAWYMKWRDDAIESAVEGHFGNPRYKDALYKRAQYQEIPAPWQLADENAITVFTLWLIENYSDE